MRAANPISDIVPVQAADVSDAYYGLQQQQINITMTATVAIEKNTTVYQSKAAEAVCALEALLKD